MDISKPQERNKILIVVSILFILSLILIFVRLQRSRQLEKAMNGGKSKEPKVEKVLPTDQTSQGSYTVSLNRNNLKVGEIVTTRIIFAAENKIISGADAFVKFDPDFLEVSEEVIVGDYFSSYPRQEVDNQEGEIKVTGWQSVKETHLVGEAILFTVDFIAKKPGTTTIDMEFEKGKTNLSTLVEKDTSKNILGKINEATVVIAE